MKKIYLFFALLFVVLSGPLKAQDIHFSQVFETPLFLSPANTGFFNGYFRAIANYRNQWSPMGKPYQTIGLSIDGGLFKSKKRKAFVGMGLTVFNDRAGSAGLSKTTALLNVSGILKLSKRSVFSVGIAGGADATSGNYNKLTYASQFDGNTIDPSKPTGESVVYRQFTTTDVSIGMAYEYSKVKVDQDHDDAQSFKISFGAFHLNKPTQDYGAGSSYHLPVKLVGALTTLYDFEDTKFTVTPAFVVQKQAQAWEYITGTYIKYRTGTGTKVTGQKTVNAFGVGLFYRSYDAFITKVVYEMGDYAIGMAYDFNVSGYRTASKYMGGFEISLRYNNLASSLFDARSEFK
ncbi:MAG: PorP/SprF family type IX secretion system membrane protein [Bacteroidetes bacterium]|nr:PorP/SprF family type IX secretion system membrane protein [Bacteroidota bacterium]